MMLGEIFRKPSAHKRKNKTNSFRNVQVVIHIHLPLFFLEQSRYKFLPTINLRLMQIDSHSKMQQRRSNFETSRYLFCMNTCLALVIIFKYATNTILYSILNFFRICVKRIMELVLKNLYQNLVNNYFEYIFLFSLEIMTHRIFHSMRFAYNCWFVVIIFVVNNLCSNQYKPVMLLLLKPAEDQT